MFKAEGEGLELKGPAGQTIHVCQVLDNQDFVAEQYVMIVQTGIADRVGRYRIKSNTFQRKLREPLRRILRENRIPGEIAGGVPLAGPAGMKKYKVNCRNFFFPCLQTLCTNVAHPAAINHYCVACKFIGSQLIERRSILQYVARGIHVRTCV